MDRYQKVEQKKPEIPIHENEIRITSQGLVRNYISYATSLLQERRGREIVLKAMGQAISKTVAIAEIIKRRIPRLHQDTAISSVSITDVWEPIEEGLLPVEMTRHVSMISITLSPKELNKNSPGYQAPPYMERPRPQYSNQRPPQPRQSRPVYNDVIEEPNGGNYQEGRGRGRGRGHAQGQGGGRGGRGRGWGRNGYGNYQGGGYGNYQGGGYGNYQGGGYGNYQGGGYGNYQGGGDGGGGGGGGGYGNYRDRGGYVNYQENNGYPNWSRGGGRGNSGYRGSGYGRGGRDGGGGGRGYGRGRGRTGGRPRDGEGQPQE